MGTLQKRETIKESKILSKIFGETKPTKNCLKVLLKSVGNPDHQQYAPVSEQEIVFCDNLKQCSKELRRYIEYWNMGAGNTPEIRVWYLWLDETINKVKKKTVALISFNGRLWTPEKDWEKRKEIIIGE